LKSNQGIAIMQWPGLKNFLMGRGRAQPEDPYITYFRNISLRNKGRDQQNLKPLPLLNREGWSQKNGQAISDWQRRVVERHNRDHGTDYTNWDNYNRGSNDSVRGAQIERENMRRGRKREREPHPFFGGPGQPRNRFQEKDEEWYARAIDPNGRRREMEYELGRDSAGGGDGYFGGPGGGGEGMRGATAASRAGLRRQDGRQNEGSRDAGAGAGVTFQDQKPCSEADAFLNSFGRPSADIRGSGTWSDEAEAFLNARP
jgi:hypothetical protein